MQSRESRVNLATFDGRHAVQAYSAQHGLGLTSQEQFCFELISKHRGRSVLDLGIGGGRTCAPLTSIFHAYVGIDNSPEQLSTAKSLYPGLDLRLCDVRDLNLSQSFDCVFFSFNGIDYVSPEERDDVIQRISAHLNAGGHFIYSTHNLGHSRVMAWLKYVFVKELRHPWRWIRLLPNRLLRFPLQRANLTAGWAIVNDPGLRFGLLQVYVDIQGEIDRVKQYGFEAVAQIGNLKSSFYYDENDNWVYLVFRKTE